MRWRSARCVLRSFLYLCLRIFFLRFLRTQQGDAERTVVRIDYDDAAGALLQTSVSGTLEPITAASVRRALWGHPLMTLALMARIHLQALRLWLKRVPFHRKPEAPQAFVSR
mgnify:CR=1 FL=1